MIAWLENLFNTVYGFFSNIVSIINYIVDQIRLLFGYVQGAADFVKNAFLLIPSYYLVFGTIIIVVLIVFLVLGRNAGGD